MHSPTHRALSNLSDTIADLRGFRRCIRPHTSISATVAIGSLAFGEFGDAFARTHTYIDLSDAFAYMQHAF